MAGKSIAIPPCTPLMMFCTHGFYCISRGEISVVWPAWQVLVLQYLLPVLQYCNIYCNTCSIAIHVMYVHKCILMVACYLVGNNGTEINYKLQITNYTCITVHVCVHVYTVYTCTLEYCNTCTTTRTRVHVHVYYGHS